MQNKPTIKMLGCGLLLIGFGGLLSACSDVKVTSFPTNKGYQAVATSSSEADAMQGAAKRAQLICSQQHKNLQVISTKTKYQGAFDKSTEKALDMASSTARTAGFLAPSASSDNDYITKMTFRCAD